MSASPRPRMFGAQTTATEVGQSKTANILFAVGAAGRWATDGIAVNALMPGNVGDTSLARHTDAQQLARFADTGLALPPLKTVAQGAAYALDPDNAARLWTVSQELVR